MLNSVGNGNGKKKKKTFCTCSTLSWTFICRCCRTVKLPSYTFYGENVVYIREKLLATGISPPV